MWSNACRKQIFFNVLAHISMVIDDLLIPYVQRSLITM